MPVPTARPIEIPRPTLFIAAPKTTPNVNPMPINLGSIS